jgi:hypothetical protein
MFNTLKFYTVSSEFPEDGVNKPFENICTHLPKYRGNARPIACRCKHKQEAEV